MWVCFHFLCVFFCILPLLIWSPSSVSSSLRAYKEKKKAFFCFFVIFFPLFPVELEEKKTVKRVGHSFLRRVNPLFIAFTYTNRSSLFVIKYTKQIIAVPCQPSAVVRCFNPSRRVSRRQPPWFQVSYKLYQRQFNVTRDSVDQTPEFPPISITYIHIRIHSEARGGCKPTRTPSLRNNRQQSFVFRTRF